MIFITHIPAPPAPISDIIREHTVQQCLRNLHTATEPPIPLSLGADGVWRLRQIRITVEDVPPITVEDVQRVFTIKWTF